MRLNFEQLASLAPRLLSPCKCGRGNALRIEPELRDLGPLGLAVALVCVGGCGDTRLFDAASLGLAPSSAQGAVAFNAIRH